MKVGGSTMQTPAWLQSDGQVDYSNMTQHMLQAKRSLQVCLVIQIAVLPLRCDENPLSNTNSSTACFVMKTHDG
jgi:hypothetical protein